jgi:hypothetical protein
MRKIASVIAMPVFLAVALVATMAGLVDASSFFGSGWWLLDVQAHTRSAPQPGFDLVPNSSSGEASQLLMVHVAGTTA